MKNGLLAIVLFSAFSVWGQQQTKKIIFFQPNQSSVSTVHQHQLDSLVTFIQKNECELTLIGRADSIGSEKLNLYLSGKRAKAVAAYLQSKGVDQLKITTKFLGEANPLFSNSIPKERVKNRCVEIITSCKGNNAGSSITGTSFEDSTKYTNTKFENDTIIYLPNGTQFEIEAETFYPKKIRDIDFNVTEIFSLCDMLSNNTVTRSANGDCLTSAGMLYIKPTYDGVEVQPNKEKYVRIKIPVKNGEVDKSMTLYGGVKNDIGEIVWKNLKSELSYQENGVQYYLFKTDTLYSFNLDKPIGIMCNKDGPKVKVRKYKDAMICQTYPNEKYLAVAEKLKKRKFALDKVKEEKNPVLTVVVQDDAGNPLLAKGVLYDLKYRKWSNSYIIKKKYFKRILRDFSQPMTAKDYMCNYLDN
ncbi:MAG: OmpA family protein [Vicingus serpentipes]|nr:OmpA family protein [Vicingus serpentipes]